MFREEADRRVPSWLIAFNETRACLCAFNLCLKLIELLLSLEGQKEVLKEASQETKQSNQFETFPVSTYRLFFGQLRPNMEMLSTAFCFLAGSCVSRSSLCAIGERLRTPRPHVRPTLADTLSNGHLGRDWAHTFTQTQQSIDLDLVFWW